MDTLQVYDLWYNQGLRDEVIKVTKVKDNVSTSSFSRRDGWDLSTLKYELQHVIPALNICMASPSFRMLLGSFSKLIDQVCAYVDGVLRCNER